SVIELERWDDGWRIVAPVKGDADDAQVEKFLGYVIESRNDAEYVMDADPSPERLTEFGLDVPKNVVTLKVGKELTPYTLEFGDRAPTMGVAFARLKGQRQVYRVLADAQAEADRDLYYFRDKRALKIDPVGIDQLSLTWDDQQLLVKMPDNGKWTVEKPVKATADHMRVFELLSAFSTAEVKEFTDRPATADPAFGLDAPMAKMLIWVAGDGAPTIQLAVGKRDPAKRGYYCLVTGHEGVVVLSEETINALPRKPSDLRNREIFPFDQTLVRRIEIRTASSQVALVMDKESEWRRGGDAGEVVEFQKVKEFTDELAAVKVVDFVEGGATRRSEVGLTPPEMELVVWLEGEKEPHRLTVGHRDPTGALRYAGLGDEVVTIERRFAQALVSYF
ncbi:MAG: DUF4340 domain-containing protein, partial [Nitrospinae bacterium]|nr:DUF4340 domain-containing protein [Nitrospinota bacterium]